MTERAHWERVVTDDGWHLRLVGANGEIVLTSEVYTSPGAADNALTVAARSFKATHIEGTTEVAPTSLEERDERTP